MHELLRGQRVGWHVEMRDLPGGMYTGVSASGHGQRGRCPYDSRQRGFQFPLDSTPAGLTGPPGETGAVVADIQAVAQEPATPSVGNGLLRCSARGQDSASSPCSASGTAVGASADVSAASAVVASVASVAGRLRLWKARRLASSTSAAVRSVTSAMI